MNKQSDHEMSFQTGGEADDSFSNSQYAGQEGVIRTGVSVTLQEEVILSMAA